MNLFNGSSLRKTILVVFVLHCFGACVAAESKEEVEPRAAAVVKLKTGMGDIVLALDRDRAPLSVVNFLHYVQKGHYDGTIFHRVIDGFMIQGGGLTPDMQKKPADKPIRNEADNGLKNDAYTLAMARTGDPHSATAQFFINVNDNGFLNHKARTSRGWGYAVFGEVIEGRDVVDKIKAVATGRLGGRKDVPLQPVTIVSATVTD